MRGLKVRDGNPVRRTWKKFTVDTIQNIRPLMMPPMCGASQITKISYRIHFPVTEVIFGYVALQNIIGSYAMEDVKASTREVTTFDQEKEKQEFFVTWYWV